ncbi:hypothetical protein N0V83_002222 [Neocucurbitaria cava]|uniref:Nucleotide sugar dehydrogenase n=1 Tax=Neocucurbitaria cava TaxID=798079 RepID=A0A9W8YEV1_9PLEO|nr:hypothetical protein N0V83_002222 [Neocucurbitaria cava]
MSPSQVYDSVPHLEVPARVGIIGVGYVGESLLSEFCRKYDCVGFDISADRIEQLKPSFKSYPNVVLTNDTAILRQITHYLISVPTLLQKDRSINLNHLSKALEMVLTHARPGCTVVIESSVSVGTTRALLEPFQDIMHCGMSPERVDPGRISPSAHEIPKIVAGLTPAASHEIQKLYSAVFDRVVPVSKPEVAEMTKLFENCYRMVNIAYVNEMSDACISHGIDPHEMISAAATKPFGYQEFRPGLGVGGHCIPINPFYLFANNDDLPVLKQSTDLMWARPAKLAKKFYDTLTSRYNLRFGKPKVLVVGVGFKPGESVLSNSPGLDFAEALQDLTGDRIAFYDPLVSQEAVPWMNKMADEQWTSAYINDHFDAVTVCVKQHGVDFDVLHDLADTTVYTYGKVETAVTRKLSTTARRDSVQPLLDIISTTTPAYISTITETPMDTKLGAHQAVPFLEVAWGKA